VAGLAAPRPSGRSIRSRAGARSCHSAAVAGIVSDERIAASYDADSAARYDPAVVDPAVDFLADLAGDGSALELGVGTGSFTGDSRSHVSAWRKG
jgi:hypothetical protein